MTVQEIAGELISLCRQLKFSEAQEKLYAQNIRSLEPEGTPNHDVRGMDNLKVKEEQFNGMFEVHGLEVSEPLFSGNFFSVRMVLDATHKESKQRMSLDELAVFEVSDGKVVLEQFFYPLQQSA